MKTNTHKTKNKNEIPVFYAIDENFAPFLNVAITSLLDHASSNNYYKIHILHHNLRDADRKILEEYNSDICSIIFIDVEKELNNVAEKLTLRDYYTNTIYYRLFIETLCPNYDKVVYLDADTILLDDVANLYNHDVKNYLAGVIMEDVMNNYDVFGTYSERVLGIHRTKYFNSGILVLNLKKFREEKIRDKFLDILNKFRFVLAPDQDYLNLLCKDKVLYIEHGWNRAPIPNTELTRNKLKLVHYKITWKPWKYDNVMYGEYFWHYATKTKYYDLLKQMQENYSDEQKQKDVEMFNNLVRIATEEINNPNNYYNTLNRY